MAASLFIHPLSWPCDLKTTDAIRKSAKYLEYQQVGRIFLWKARVNSAKKLCSIYIKSLCLTSAENRLQITRAADFYRAAAPDESRGSRRKLLFSTMRSWEHHKASFCCTGSTRSALVRPLSQFIGQSTHPIKNTCAGVHTHKKKKKKYGFNDPPGKPHHVTLLVS